MSRAFIREPDEAGPEPPPELKISQQPNYVTRRGLALIEAAIERVTRALAAEPDEEREALLRRDLRYWTLRHATAELREPGDPASGSVAFGSRVTLRRNGHEPEMVEIVGEDEADPAAGLLSWVSPLAAALMGGSAGDVVEVGPREPPAVVRILKVENGPV